MGAHALQIFQKFTEIPSGAGSSLLLLLIEIIAASTDSCTSHTGSLVPVIPILVVHDATEERWSHL